MTGYRQWMAGRRLAAGIDVGQDVVRVAFVSRRGSVIGIERLECEPLDASHDVAGGDWAAVTRALARVAGRAGARLPVGRMPAAMALSCREVAMSMLDARLAADGPLEPAVLVEAERATGMARDSLAIDWCVNDILHPGRVMIASTDRARIDVRVEAAAAGFGLTAIDGEPHAALRAIRQVAALEVEADAPYAAIWIGAGGMDGWRVEATTATTHVRAPSPARASVADALRELARRGGEIDCAFVGGALDEGVEDDARGGPGAIAARLAEIGDLLGCAALPFECAAYCRRPGIDAAACHSPRFAVAFGLGLRGVCE
ncbi:pilus assembly protein PilM [Burkholderia glumae]|uniref:pilus assembly protein PilM n=1 Tax=Burkholderia glumae TaxID=337 RepID=UPI0020375313|nr:pilus assembly protein PilM [Burkholderia glumae]MCM2491826.1 pilus assembly protein PilM [Burkholderia glumae]MCM2542815.1 pilus assembly protein PilM [Burkholderia glumae]